MKKLIFSSFFLASVLLFCAFRPHISQTIQAKSLAVLLRTAASTWTNMVSQTFYMAYGVEKLNDQGLRDEFSNRARTGIFNEYETDPCRTFGGDDMKMAQKKMAIQWIISRSIQMDLILLMPKS